MVGVVGVIIGCSCGGSCFMVDQGHITCWRIDADIGNCYSVAFEFMSLVPSTASEFWKVTTGRVVVTDRRGGTEIALD